MDISFTDIYRQNTEWLKLRVAREIENHEGRERRVLQQALGGLMLLDDTEFIDDPDMESLLQRAACQRDVLLAEYDVERLREEMRLNPVALYVELNVAAPSR